MSGRLILIARCFLFSIGCMALWWSIDGLSSFWRQSSIERIANRIIAGESFNVALLRRQLPIIEGIERATKCRQPALRSAAIIRLRMIEAAASSGDHKYGDEDLRLLDDTVRSSLSCL